MRSIVLAFLMFAAPLSDPPKVSVDTSGLQFQERPGWTADRLRGWLVARLLEEGYVVVPDPKQATLQVSVRRTREGFLVQAEGASRRSYRVEKGPVSVVSMEVLHRAMLALQQTRERTEGQDPKRDGENRDSKTMSAALELVGGQDSKLDAFVLEEVALSLSKAGVTLTPGSVAHDSVVCVGLQDGAVVLGSAHTKQECLETASRVARASQSEATVSRLLRERVEHDFSGQGGEQLELEGSETEPPLPQNPSRARSTLPAPETDRGSTANESERPNQAQKDDRVRLSLSGGGLLRVGGTDPVLEALGTLGITPRLRLLFQTQLSPSSASLGPAPSSPSSSPGAVSTSDAGELDILELGAGLGLAWSFETSGALGYSIGVVGGARLHRYYVDTSDQGVRLGWRFSIPLEASLAVDWLVLRLAAEPGIAGPVPKHTMLGKPVWQRDVPCLALLIGAGVSL